jgi:hypothetical protein
MLKLEDFIVLLMWLGIALGLISVLAMSMLEGSE